MSGTLHKMLAAPYIMLAATALIVDKDQRGALGTTKGNATLTPIHENTLVSRIDFQDIRNKKKYNKK